ncbi:hypothetical protein GCM10009117_04090 [Gangjinia marincola]|uniref:LPXTG cell wall anchor domain-containing protein n=1 Tax=Gangjinia marincola TaxID=578463 RepID=A0ABN1MDX3_9FLAO
MGNLSDKTELLIIGIGLVVLFFAVIANSRKNNTSIRNRKTRKFGERIAKRKGREEES